MKIEVSLRKRYFLGLVLIVLVAMGVVGVVAFNLGVTSTSGNPAAFGHSVDEMDWSATIQKNVSAAGFCLNGVCKTAWEQISGTAGSDTTSPWLIKPAAGYEQEAIYYTNGKVGIGTSSPTVALEVGGAGTGKIPYLTTSSITFPDGTVQSSAGCKQEISTSASAQNVYLQMAIPLVCRDDGFREPCNLILVYAPALPTAGGMSWATFAAMTTNTWTSSGIWETSAASNIASAKLSTGTNGDTTASQIVAIDTFVSLYDDYNLYGETAANMWTLYVAAGKQATLYVCP